MPARQKCTLRLDSDLKEAIKREAKKEHRTVNSFISHTLADRCLDQSAAPRKGTANHPQEA
jgi:hypothetical protein